MAYISLQQLYDAWKRVSDWVSGTGSDKPKVQNINSSGAEIFTATTPGVVKVSDGTRLLVVNADGSVNTQLTGSIPTGANTIGKLSITSATAQEAVTSSANVDAVSNTAVGLLTNSRNFTFNESTFDRLRGNTQTTILASAARTITTLSPTQTNYNAKGIIVYLNITAASGTGGLIPRIYGVDPVAGIALVSLVTDIAPITATGLYAIELSPGATGTTTVGMKARAAGTLPRSFVVGINVGDASSYTYSVGCALII